MRWTNAGISGAGRGAAPEDGDPAGRVVPELLQRVHDLVRQRAACRADPLPQPPPRPHSALRPPAQRGPTAAAAGGSSGPLPRSVGARSRAIVGPRQVPNAGERGARLRPAAPTLRASQPTTSEPHGSSAAAGICSCGGPSIDTSVDSAAARCSRAAALSQRARHGASAGAREGNGGAGNAAAVFLLRREECIARSPVSSFVCHNP